MFNGDILRDAMISAANSISNRKTSVDDLNVFPVPDGDTGTNMSMSLQGVLKEMKKIEGLTASEVADITASALLRSARGNSGVITSLIFRGFQKGLKGHDEINAENLTACFTIGTECAYNAVMKPTEGTMLTVIRVASEYASEALKAGKDTLGVFDAALEGARTALAQTPEMLPVLKKAGVVDAGGQGILYILEGMYSVFKDGKIIEAQDAPAQESEPAARASAAGELEDFDINFPYCTEFLVTKNEDCGPVAELREYLESIGDCVVAVEDDTIIKVHVHTAHPGNALEKALTFGALINLKIENMQDQHERAKHNTKNENYSKKADKELPNAPVNPEKPYGFVAVAAGDGFAELFCELGVDKVVSGGQTMNPSTQDILAAIEQTPAETVFVLPNNKNIIMAAEQTIDIATRKVIVLHTRTVPEGISAIIAFDPDADAEQNAINMKAEYQKVTTGQITFAARDSSIDGKKINKGDLLCMENGKIVFTETELEKATLRLAKQMIKKDTSLVTVYYGSDVNDSTAEAIYSQINDKFGAKADIALVKGNQPIYYFIISAE